MFDYHEPVPVLVCPRCGAELREWQGKDGPSALFVWRQRERYPIDQRAGDSIEPENRLRFQLPRRFTISTNCCSREFLIDAVGEAPAGTWLTTAVVGIDDIDSHYYFEPKAKRAARKAWLGARTSQPAAAADERRHQLAAD